MTSIPGQKPFNHKTSVCVHSQCGQPELCTPVFRHERCSNLQFGYGSKTRFITVFNDIFCSYTVIRVFCSREKFQDAFKTKHIM